MNHFFCNNIAGMKTAVTWRQATSYQTTQIIKSSPSSSTSYDIINIITKSTFLFTDMKPQVWEVSPKTKLHCVKREVHWKHLQNLLPRCSYPHHLVVEWQLSPGAPRENVDLSSQKIRQPAKWLCCDQISLKSARICLLLGRKNLIVFMQIQSFLCGVCAEQRSPRTLQTHDEQTTFQKWELWDLYVPNYWHYESENGKGILGTLGISPSLTVVFLSLGKACMPKTTRDTFQQIPKWIPKTDGVVMSISKGLMASGLGLETSEDFMGRTSGFNHVFHFKWWIDVAVAKGFNMSNLLNYCHHYIHCVWNISNKRIASIKGTSSSGGGVAVRAKVSTSGTWCQVPTNSTVAPWKLRPKPQQRKGKDRWVPTNHQPPPDPWAPWL